VPALHGHTISSAHTSSVFLLGSNEIEADGAQRFAGVLAQCAALAQLGLSQEK
jgi:hypothetical protein